MIPELIRTSPFWWLAIVAFVFYQLGVKRGWHQHNEVCEKRKCICHRCDDPATYARRERGEEID